LAAYRVEVDRTKCIACSTCYSSGSVFFEPDGAGPVRIVGGTTDELCSFKVFDDDNMETASSIASYCPVSGIRVTASN
jgi:ferredoxin